MGPGARRSRCKSRTKYHSVGGVFSSRSLNGKGTHAFSGSLSRLLFCRDQSLTLSRMGATRSVVDSSPAASLVRVNTVMSSS